MYAKTSLTKDKRSSHRVDTHRPRRRSQTSPPCQQGTEKIGAYLEVRSADRMNDSTALRKGVIEEHKVTRFTIMATKGAKVTWSWRTQKTAKSQS